MRENKTIDKPWGYELIWAHTDTYVGKYLFIERGHKLSKQYHEEKDETIMVLSGRLKLEIGDGEDMVEHMMKAYDSYHITPGTIHLFVAAYGPAHLVEVSTTELDDVVRLEDDYNRS